MTRDPREYKLHVASLEHILSAFPQVKPIHVPNQTRDATEAFFNKKMGVVPGVSDFLIGWSRSDYGGAGVGVLELKAPDGRLSPNQNKFMSWAHHIGWATGEARSVRQVHNVLVSWGLKPVHTGIREPDYRTLENKIKQAYDFYAPPDLKYVSHSFPKAIITKGIKISMRWIVCWLHLWRFKTSP